MFTVNKARVLFNMDYKGVWGLFEIVILWHLVLVLERSLLC